MPWLTPDSIPEGDDCRPLSIPASSAWLALVSGALTELTLKYNWQKFGTLTVDETVAKMQEIVDGYYNSPCTQCELPGGGKIIRIAPDGTLQELDSDGEWTDATGDYEIPQPAAQTGIDPNCLAAANAVNVLFHLYNDLSMSWASHLSEAEALTSFTLAAIALVGFEFAPITAGIVAFFGAVFTALYEALAYLGAGLWDDKVSNQIQCFLYACATNVDGVVSFDWECFLGQLNSLTDNFLLSETQLRLYLQITYILYFIGGVKGLNLAGGTTAITEADCSICNVCDPCAGYDLTTAEGSGCVTPIAGEFVLGQGQHTLFNSNPDQLNDVAAVTVNTPDDVTPTSVEMDYNCISVGGAPLAIISTDDGATNLVVDVASVGMHTVTYTLGTRYDTYTFAIILSQGNTGGGDGYITAVRYNCE